MSSSGWPKTLILTVALVILVVGFSAARGRADESIAGQVTDETKAVVPGVTVTVTNPATGLVREAVTDREGNFLLSALSPVRTHSRGARARISYVRLGRCFIAIG